MSGALRSIGSWLSATLWRELPWHPPATAVCVPDDEGPHRVPVEWWYIVGQIDSTDRGDPQRLAFELTVTRLSDPVTASLSGWAAVFAFIDPGRGQYRVVERTLWLPGSPLQDDPGRVCLRVGDGDLRLRAEDWVLEGWNGQWHLRAHLPSGEGVDLDLAATKPAVAFGRDGVVDYGGRETMAWYAWTRMQATGTSYDGEMVRPVSGLCWMGHQWGAPWLDGYTWKVTSIHLESGDDVMAFRMTDKASGLVTARCARIGPAGATHEVGVEGVEMSDLSPPIRYEQAVYRPATRLVAPELGLDLTIRPLLLDQRKRTQRRWQAVPVWWEGACDVEGTLDGAPVRGRAFVEIAGVE